MERNDLDINNAIPDMPQSFAARTEAVLSSLPDKAEGRRARLRLGRRSAAVLIAAILLALSVTALAATGVIKLSRSGGIIDFFNGNDRADLAAQKEHYERINDKVDVVLTSGDVELTVNNIALGLEDITVFYTVSSAYPIEDGAEMPRFRASIDGGATACAFTGETNAQRVDANTFECMQVLNLLEPLPEQCTLTVYCRELFGVEKYVSAEMLVDTTGSDVHVSEDETLIRVGEHEIIARIYIDADGGVLELRETVPEDWGKQPPYYDTFIPFVDFALYNEAGEPLHAHIVAVSSSGVPGRELINRVRFDTDMETEAITIAPITGYDLDSPVYADVMFDELGTVYTVYDGFELSLTDVSFDLANRTITVSYKEDGVTPVSSKSSLHYFMDEDGQRLECGDVASSEEIFRDDATGVYTQTLYFLTDSFYMARVKGIRFFYNEPQIDIENAVVIPVSHS